MSDALANMPSTFKDALRAKVLEATMNLMPVDQMDEYIEREVRAFFDTEQMLTITPTKVTVENPAYRPHTDRGYSPYSSPQKELTNECLVIGSKMTPFRQLVWTTLFEHLRPILVTVVDDETSQVRKSLDAWIVEIMKPTVGEVNKDMFSTLSTAMAKSMFSDAINDSVGLANLHLRNTLGAAGVDTSRIPQMSLPVFNRSR